jgi:hypothetical protein
MITLFESKTILRASALLAIFGSASVQIACGSDSNATGPSPSSFTTGGSSGTGGTDGGVSGSGGGFNSGGFSSGGFSGSQSSGGSGGSLSSGGAGGSPSSGGSSGSATGGSPGGTPDAGDGGTCIQPSAPTLDPTIFPACKIATLPNCTDGRCVPNGLVPSSAQALLADCDATDKCAPSIFVSYNNLYTSPTCVSVDGAEGRCLSECIPLVSQQATFLPKANCGDGQLCAPCFDPRTGDDTGACHQGCDTGPKDPPKLFDKCCGGQGACVPKTLVPAADLTLLGPDTCTDSTALCAPNKLSQPGYVPATCKSISGIEGRCLADCIPQVASDASELPKDTCDTGELCAPCYDPFTGKDTGACTQNGDKPVNPPTTFPQCCSDLGHCIPTNALSSAQVSELGADTCTTGDLCAPDVFAEPGETAAKCSATLGGLDAEGRCIPNCVPLVQKQASELSQGSCVANMLCAPCYDPVTGKSTDACSQNGDKPVDPPKTFTGCCALNGTDRGACIPTALVPPADVSTLGTDTCTGTNQLCAPTELVDPTYKPPSCNSLGGLEGRCLPDCIPQVAAQKSELPQSTCVAGDLCAPCYDPFTGKDTGACTQNGDKPTNPAGTFPQCCGDLGHCIPTASLSSAQQSELGADTCSTGNLCAPDIFAEPGDTATSCTAALGGLDAEGRCVPPCVPAIQKQASELAQGTCPANTLCAPCYDPVSGASTDACSQNGDAPKQPAKTFPGCCTRNNAPRGACVPTSLVPTSEASALPQDTCDTGSLCAPDLKAEDPTAKFKSCHIGASLACTLQASLSGGCDGACVPDCLPPSSEKSFLTQGPCAAGELCAPCVDPTSSTGARTGACD